jgi:hypothetical protein
MGRSAPDRLRYTLDYTMDYEIPNPEGPPVRCKAADKIGGTLAH